MLAPVMQQAGCGLLFNAHIISFSKQVADARLLLGSYSTVYSTAVEMVNAQ